MYIPYSRLTFYCILIFIFIQLYPLVLEITDSLWKSDEEKAIEFKEKEIDELNQYILELYDELINLAIP